MSTPNLADRLEQGSMPEPTTGCHIWLGSTNGRGYGQLSVRGRTKRAHVAAYEIAKGPVPASLELDHLCRTPQCVNPEHLEAVTHAENNRRRAARRVVCRRGHLLSDDNIKIQNGARTCLECHRQTGLAYYYRATDGGPRRRPKSERGRAVLKRAQEQGR